MTGSKLPGLILVAVDGSDESSSAASYAIEMAKSTGAGLVAVHVVHLPEYASEEMKIRLKEDLGKKGENSLNAVAKAAEGQKVEFRHKTLDTTSSVVDAICGFASSEKVGLIVLGTRGAGGVAKLMLGSVAMGVAKSAPCPVLVVR